jgi:hypothetical protein
VTVTAGEDEDAAAALSRLSLLIAVARNKSELDSGGDQRAARSRAYCHLDERLTASCLAVAQRGDILDGPERAIAEGRQEQRLPLRLRQEV